ncbi:hypothetical protein [Giesbergeria anulus]|uniref:Uncharacterized protein n=1 Tax=Giesbergeria anulus TaxID=180197 RepID=A0A1H9L7S0_9BURK|nr:hypothetical protein [Giesbergeria anulus]SER07207.1 hypothetical protein SAMN02982919_01682 [Giesbergeria anulus]
MSFATTQKFLSVNYGVTMQQALDFVAASLESPQTIFNVCKQAAITNQMLADIISPVLPDVLPSMVAQYFASFGLDATQLDPVTPPDGGAVIAKTVNVTGAGQHTDAAQDNTSYMIGLNGEYNYTIQNFAAGDKLIFPAANLATVINESFTDGQLVVNYAFAGQMATITLVGVPDSLDSNIFGPTSFKSAFGSDALN